MEHLNLLNSFKFTTCSFWFEQEQVLMRVTESEVLRNLVEMYSSTTTVPNVDGM